MDERELIRQRRAEDLAMRFTADRSPVVESHGSFFRPNELLASTAAREHLADELAKYRATPYEEGSDPAHWRQNSWLPRESRDDLNTTLESVGTTLLTLRTSDVVDLVGSLDALLRARIGLDEGHPSGVNANQVFIGEPIYQGGPGGPPFPADPPALDLGPSMISGTPDLAVLDTGLPFEWASVHQELDPFLVPDGTDFRSRKGAGGYLATHSGHGLFICGLVQRVASASGLLIDPGKVIDTTGVGDDATITAELLETQAKVINLSLGGYTIGDHPPQGLAAAIAGLGRNRVVVAAAGNNSSSRPFWPAALKGVIAVAAYDSRGGGVERTTFSNYGPWVDVCAPGQDLGSTFFPGMWPPPPGGQTIELGDGAGWSGTSFAAPLVAAEIALRVRDSSRSPRQVAYEFLASLDESPWPDDLGLIYTPPLDLTVPRNTAGQES